MAPSRKTDAALIRAALENLRQIESNDFGGGDVEWDRQQNPALRATHAAEDAALARLEKGDY